MLPEYASTSTRPPAGVLRGGLVGGMIVLGGLFSESATASSVPVPAVRDRTAASMPGQRIIGKGSRRTADGADVSVPIAEILAGAGLTVSSVRTTTRGTIRVAQELRDRIRHRGLRVQALAYPLMASAVALGMRRVRRLRPGAPSGA